MKLYKHDNCNFALAGDRVNQNTCTFKNKYASLYTVYFFRKTKNRGSIVENLQHSGINYKIFL